MHFTTLFLLKNQTLESTSFKEVEEEFLHRFCCCCGEATPKYGNWCDWFQIGGRWSDLEVLSSNRGIKGEKSWCNADKKATYCIVEIKDLNKPIDEEMILAIATKSKIYKNETEKFTELLEKINSKKIKGIVALIDCHD